MDFRTEFVSGVGSGSPLVALALNLSNVAASKKSGMRASIPESDANDNAVGAPQPDQICETAAAIPFEI